MLRYNNSFLPSLRSPSSEEGRRRRRSPAHLANTKRTATCYYNKQHYVDLVVLSFIELNPGSLSVLSNDLAEERATGCASNYLTN